MRKRKPEYLKSKKIWTSLPPEVIEWVGTRSHRIFREFIVSQFTKSVLGRWGLGGRLGVSSVVNDKKEKLRASRWLQWLDLIVPVGTIGNSVVFLFGFKKPNAEGVLEATPETASFVVISPTSPTILRQLIYDLTLDELPTLTNAQKSWFEEFRREASANIPEFLAETWVSNPKYDYLVQQADELEISVPLSSQGKILDGFNPLKANYIVKLISSAHKRVEL